MLLNLSAKEKCYALFGNVLGDGTYYLGTHSIQIQHTKKQRAYVKWLEQLYASWGILISSSYGKIRNTTHGTYVYDRVYIRVPQHRHFENNRIYRDRKKVASLYVLKRINRLGMLLWFLDDGSLTVQKINHGSYYSIHRFATLHTEGFDLCSQQRIQTVMSKRFGIELRLHRTNKGGSGWKLYFSALQFRRFYDLVREYLPYVPPEMMYKFNMKYEHNRIHESDQLALRYNGINSLGIENRYQVDSHRVIYDE